MAGVRITQCMLQCIKTIVRDAEGELNCHILTEQWFHWLETDFLAKAKDFLRNLNKANNTSQISLYRCATCIELFSYIFSVSNTFKKSIDKTISICGLILQASHKQAFCLNKYCRNRSPYSLPHMPTCRLCAQAVAAETQSRHWTPLY